jgi:copper oxidase (laccase) domain-containing protein
VIEASVERFASSSVDLHAWLGPAIGPQKFVVGEDVLTAFMNEAVHDKGRVEAAFTLRDEGQWLADIYALAKVRLHRLGIENVTGGDFCTVTDRQMFYSYRRDGITGRMASLIWIADETGAD